ncbi:GNAT family N-acetyltransferase [Streptomyces sp. NPDC005498]|uniref:GNAT family N-acetyltransferase n=1 Tax=Streptomyces sp. NPDC005498 TaxID=3364717 RepID=UPI00369B5728
MAKVRDRGNVLGFGVPAALFLPGVAYLGITNGHHFIANDFFALMYCLASVGFASVPLMAWRTGGGLYPAPGFGRSAWLPWLFTTEQGVAYSATRGDANVFILIFGWGMFIYAGMVALYFLGAALWNTGDGQTVPETGCTTSPLDEYVGRPTSGDRARPAGAMPCLLPVPGNPCYLAWREQSLSDLDQAVEDGEHTSWAKILAEEVRAAYPGVHLSLRTACDHLLLFLIVVPDGERNTGFGTRVMQHLTAAADLRGVGMTLTPSTNFGAELDRLRGFYRRFGFVTNKWHGQIGAASEEMVRVPRNPSSATGEPACSSGCCEI